MHLLRGMRSGGGQEVCYASALILNVRPAHNACGVGVGRAQVVFWPRQKVAENFIIATTDRRPVGKKIARVMCETLANKWAGRVSNDVDDDGVGSRTNEH